MRFWDASAVLPLCVEEPRSPQVMRLAQEDGDIVVWWATQVECYSALARWRREGALAVDQETQVRSLLDALAREWTEVLPGEEVRRGAIDLLRSYSLRAGDALQLSAARLWAGGQPAGQAFVCLDGRLREAALRDGFTVLPR